MIQFNAGEILELAVRRQNINISELSRKMNVNRRTIYNWFQQQSLSSTIIFGISQAIDYDITQEFPENFFGQALNAQKQHTGLNSIAEHEEARYYWMRKYISLLEDYKVLLEKTKSMHARYD